MPDRALKTFGHHTGMTNELDLVAATFDLLPSQMALLDDRGMIRYTNHAWNAFARDNGYTGGPFEGMDYLSICTCVQGVEKDQAQAFATGLRSVIQGERERFELVYPCHSPDTRRWFKGIVYRYGEHIAVMHIDITEEYSDLDQLTGFLTSTELVHDLRAPLNAILGFAQLIRMMGAHEIDRIHKNADIINDSGQRLLRLVNDILTVAEGRYEHVSPPEEDIALLALLSTIIGELRPLSQNAHIAIELDVPESLRIVGHREGLWKLFANLIGNAIKYNRAGGWVRVQARVNVSGGVVIDVADNGLGVRADQQDKIFEPFFRAQGEGPEMREGSGLGLAICRDISRQHGGELSVKSVLGEGSTFTVCLPGWRTVPLGDLG